ncbi:putative site-specific integrase-resolvase [Puniceicoccus vermicola]
MNAQAHAETAKKLITRHEAAERYSFSIRALDNYISAGIIPVIRLSPRCVRIPVVKADAAFDRLTTGGAR